MKVMKAQRKSQRKHEKMKEKATHTHTRTQKHTLIIRSREKRNPKTADPLHVRNNEEHKEQAEAATNA